MRKTELFTKLVVVLIWLAFLAFLSGCSGQGGSQTKQPTPDKGFPVTVTDDLGRQVKIEAEPQRIISLSPSNTEILFALGLDKRIVGVTTFCNYPPEAQDKEKVGGFSDPSIEKIVSLKPDLVVAGDLHAKIADELQKLSIPVIVVSPKSIEGTLESIEMVGKATGCATEARQVAQSIRSKMDEVKAKVQQTKDRPRVYYEVWYNPLVTAGPKTVINDLISLCGGINIADDAATAWPQYSEEMVIAKNPDVIIHSYGHGDLQAANLYDRPGGWRQINAVRQGHIYTVNADIVNRPGPRLVQAIDEFARCIHPELFK